MANRFLKHITSEYIDATTRFASKERRMARKIMVYVEGYDDISFWRDVLAQFETEQLYFEISVPSRSDLAKGKRVLLNMLDSLGKNLILCMDSDFDYLFQGKTTQSEMVLNNKYIVHTYAYSIENLLCYSKSLKNVCVKATKNDIDIFNINHFVTSYSSTIFPLFLWYAYSALNGRENLFVLSDFKNSVRLNFVDIKNDGESTLQWLSKSVQRRLKLLEEENVKWIPRVKDFGREIAQLGITRDNCYLFMNGHTLMDNILIMLQSITEVLKVMKINQIKQSSRIGISLENELSNYKNSLRNVENILKDNDQYKNSFLYDMIIKRVKAALIL